VPRHEQRQRCHNVMNEQQSEANLRRVGKAAAPAEPMDSEMTVG